MVVEAVLLIDSQGLAPAVRGAAFQHTWSKLFQADGYHIDLSFAPATSSGTLQGQVLGGRPHGGADVTLFRGDGTAAARAPLGSGGDFVLSVLENRRYRLQVDLGDVVLRISELPLS